MADLDAARSECWVCYDSERTDAGPMILPCLCKGDVAAVHHDCLKRWLIEVQKRRECEFMSVVVVVVVEYRVDYFLSISFDSC